MSKLSRPVLDKIDELVDSDDAVKAASGRLMAVITPGMRDWLEDERLRDTESPDIMIAMGKVLAIQLSAFVLSAAKPTRQAREGALRAMADAVHSDITQFAENGDIGDKFDRAMARKMGH